MGSRLVRRGDQRHLRGAQGALPAPLAVEVHAPPRAADRARATARSRALVAGGRPGRRGPLADGARPRPGNQPPRAPRHRHPRGGGGGGHQRRLRIGLSGPSSDGGGRARATRVLRGRPRSGAVRAARRRRSAQGRARRCPGCGARPGGHRPGPTVRGRPGLAADRGRRAASAAAGCRRPRRDRGWPRGALPRARRSRPAHPSSGGGRRATGSRRRGAAAPCRPRRSAARAAPRAGRSRPGGRVTPCGSSESGRFSPELPRLPASPNADQGAAVGATAERTNCRRQLNTSVPESELMSVGDLAAILCRGIIEVRR